MLIFLFFLSLLALANSFPRRTLYNGEGRVMQFSYAFVFRKRGKPATGMKALKMDGGAVGPDRV
jgi:hypothetical protein